MEPIAIIGIGCRFPGADNPPAFWQLLRDGVDAITEVPADRWSLDEFYDPNPETPGKTNTRWGGFLKEVDKFDPSFFRISAREAERMDPHQRLLLEVVWEALEDAGQTRERLFGTPCGVFIGMSNNDYAHIQMRKHSLIDTQLGSGSAAGMAPNRVSYFLNLQGPSLIVDTQCSSSLVAVHLACQSLWNEESAPLAIAGGVNVLLLPLTDILYTKAKMTAADGRCKAFDARADGFVRGEGAGIVILKRWSQAVSDGDPIYCVIRGSAVNQRGRTNGLTAPSQWSQTAVLREAYRKAGVSPGRVQYVEAHGTGTSLGDAIEAAALGAVVALERPAGDRCAIGSVKTNIGHLEAAGGIVGLIKTVLMMKHRELPPSLHFQQPSPYIPFADLPLRVQQALEPWPTTDSDQLLAGVSSFGIGGTNAHVVVEESKHPDVERIAREESVDHEAYLFSLSAHSPLALQSLARAYAEFLGGEALCQGISLKDFCYTASARRSQHDHRLAFPARSPDEMTAYLEAFSRGERMPGLSSGRIVPARPTKLAFVFSGQESQWLSEGQGLLREEPLFRSTVEECDELFFRLAGWSLMEELTADVSRSRLDQREVARPALFALQVALAALWRSWGIEPDAVVGDGVGEVAAAHVAGALSLTDALRVVFDRASLTRKATGHSQHVEPVQSEPADTLKGIEARSTTIPILSTVTGRAIDGQEFDASYWGRQIGQPVLFAAAVDVLIADGFRAFLELSPHPAHSGSITQCLSAHELEGTVLASLRRGQPGRVTMLQTLGALYCLVRSVRWDKLYPADARCVRLPCYAWQRERFWLTEEDAEPEQVAERVAVQGQPPPPQPETPAPLEQTKFIDRLRESAPEERSSLLATHIRAEVGRIMGLKAAQLPHAHENLLEAGMGSLMAVELGSSLKDSLEDDFPITAMFEYQTIAAITGFLLTEVLVFESPVAGQGQQIEPQGESILPEAAHKR